MVGITLELLDFGPESKSLVCQRKSVIFVVFYLLNHAIHVHKIMHHFAHTQEQKPSKSVSFLLSFVPRYSDLTVILATYFTKLRLAPERYPVMVEWHPDGGLKIKSNSSQFNFDIKESKLCFLPSPCDDKTRHSYKVNGLRKAELENVEEKQTHKQNALMENKQNQLA